MRVRRAAQVVTVKMEGAEGCDPAAMQLHMHMQAGHVHSSYVAMKQGLLLPRASRACRARAAMVNRLL